MENRDSLLIECGIINVYKIICMASARLDQIQGHVSSLTIKLLNPSSTMAKFDINSKKRMLSGYDIPVLGYGVREPARFPYDLI